MGFVISILLLILIGVCKMRLSERESLGLILSRFVAVCLCGVGLVRGADTKPGGPWQSLFNGNNLSGWVPMNDAVFFATNGCIHLAKSSGWLRTERQFTNFVFEAEWRALHSNNNSRFFLRAGLTGKPSPPEASRVHLKGATVRRDPNDPKNA